MDILKTSCIIKSDLEFINSRGKKEFDHPLHTNAISKTPTQFFTDFYTNKIEKYWLYLLKNSMLDAYLMTLCIQMEYPWTATSTGMAVPVLAALRIIYMILVGTGKDLEVSNSSWQSSWIKFLSSIVITQVGLRCRVVRIWVGRFCWLIPPIFDSSAEK